MNKTPRGFVQSYPCTCYGPEHVCYIVRHPDLSPPVSYPTEAEAQARLDELERAAAARDTGEDHD